MLSLSARNFSRNMRRYRVLLAALALAVAALVVLIGLLEGLHFSVRQKAARYFAGDVTVQAFQGGGSVPFQDAEEVLKRVAAADLHAKTVVARSIYTRMDATLFFAGSYVNQRRVAGVDWDNEFPVLSTLDFVSGGVPQETEAQAEAATTVKNSALISTAVAERLQARVGDEIILSLATQRGRRNTVQLVISGIYDEHSFFGYTVYMDRRTLNTAQELHADAVHEIGVHLRSHRHQDAAAATLYETLSESGNGGVFPVWQSREDRSASLGSADGAEYSYGIMTLEAQLDEINNLLQALSLIAGGAIAAFLLIMVVGVANTYVMITFERTREIGTLRALGLTRLGTLRLLVNEAIIMGLSATVLGVPLGFAVLHALHLQLDLSDNALATLFLVQGKLVYTVPLFWFVLIFAAVGGAAVVGSLKPSIRAALLPPAGALQQE